MAETLEPVPVVIRSSDLVFIRSKLAQLPPIEHSEAMRRFGWTDEALLLGRLLGSLCNAMRSGDFDLEVQHD